MKQSMKRKMSNIEPPESSSGGDKTPPLWALAAGMCGMYAVLILDRLFAEPGTPGYGANQSGLITFAVAVILVIPLRIRIWRLHRNAPHSWPRREYWRDGSGVMDLLFLMTALVLVLLVDWKLVPERGIRIGVVGAIAIGASIVAWFARRARRKRDRASSSDEDKK